MHIVVDIVMVTLCSLVKVNVGAKKYLINH